MRGLDMDVAEIPGIVPDEFSRCTDHNQVVDYRMSLSPVQKSDSATKAHIERALWNDEVLRAIEAYDVVVHVRNGVVYLSGHIMGASSQARIKKAIRGIPGILGVQSNLVLDDRLTLEVAGSLGTLEHTYGCKFYTGASHGVISLNGTVNDENVKFLAEKRVSSHPGVRGVINNVRVTGAGIDRQELPFLQPTIGATIYFRDGISGVVKQVVVNPDNRRVVAMIVWAQFADQREELKSLASGKALAPQRLIVVPVDVVRHMTRVSGFLQISTGDKDQFMDFDLASFRTPTEDWEPPYPYCRDDVLFAVEKRQVEYQILERLPRSPFVVKWVEQPLSEELLANDSLGG